MASTSTKATTTKSILNPVTTLKGHGGSIHSIAYFPDCQRMISGSGDKTTRQWDLKASKEIEEAQDVGEKEVYAVAVSRDGRWVVTGGDDWNAGLKACEVETGIMKTFKGHSQTIFCIDISTDNTLLASGSADETARIWNLETGKLVAGPFKSVGRVGAVRFSPDSKKLAVRLDLGTCLEVWDVQSQKLDVSIGKPSRRGVASSPIFWSNGKNKTIIAAFKFKFSFVADSVSDLDIDDHTKSIYEFDAVTLKTVGAPFEGHTKHISGLALSFDDTLLASASGSENTIKLWAFESRQLLASFDVQNIAFPLFLSPDSCQLVYLTSTKDDHKICICDTPPDILAQARTIARKKSARRDLLNSDATRRPPAGHRRPPISAIPMAPRPPPARDPQQSTFLRLSKLLRFSPRTNAVRNDQHRDPLDFSATLPLPRSLLGNTSTQGRSDMNPGDGSRPLSTTRLSATPPTTFADRIYHPSSWWPVRGGHAQTPIVDVPLAQAKERNAAAGAPKKDKDIVPIEYLDPPSPNPDSQQPVGAVQTSSGEHGGDRSCFCF
ncbi:WD40 repeat-like protein [Suillus weaverae]|nr:WD40 repeat-like protein [Suillus weaverae]